MREVRACSATTALSGRGEISGTGLQHTGADAPCECPVVSVKQSIPGGDSTVTTELTQTGHSSLYLDHHYGHPGSLGKGPRRKTELDLPPLRFEGLVNLRSSRVQAECWVSHLYRSVKSSGEKMGAGAFDVCAGCDCRADAGRSRHGHSAPGRSRPYGP
ncbi:hypothetical protein RRG08_060476 [Elysia crispata]|uniref:Uncharacterized protein n=1 Tax=Elysia crispata TaxID=231223 RepID=A0AAE1E7S6_9GAST|nr:hypothetical protein RRG08_060476 [Elysia crispata]